MDYYVIASLPFQAGIEQQPSAQFTKLQERLGQNRDAIRHFTIPAFRVGTLDSLMEASDELAKVDPLLEGVSIKIASILEDVTQKSRAAVCTLPVPGGGKILSCDDYVKHFSWNAAQFDTKEHVATLIEKLQQLAVSTEDRIRNSVTEFTDVRNKLNACTRKAQCNFASCGINEHVDLWKARGHQVVNSEFLITVFIAVPSTSAKDFMKSYWKMSSFVCPQSHSIVGEDEEYTLFSVVVFKRVLEDFKIACRKQKFIVRELDHGSGTDSTPESLNQEVERQRSSLIHLLTHQFTVCFVAWVHCKALRIFVESVLKYGLPPKFLPVLLACDSRKEAIIRKSFAQGIDLYNPLVDDPSVIETGALQYQYPYISLKMTNIGK
eukprot:Tbor_TRINITY_DN6061_c5_g3::TRINITY_DN6061_c5_g3_i1::g.11503::m.11503/K02148/ATPeV1C, ATP6C; V-type H+-transporting ATPase subunit C